MAEASRETRWRLVRLAQGELRGVRSKETERGRSPTLQDLEAFLRAERSRQGVLKQGTGKAASGL